MDTESIQRIQQQSSPSLRCHSRGFNIRTDGLRPRTRCLQSVGLYHPEIICLLRVNLCRRRSFRSIRPLASHALSHQPLNLEEHTSSSQTQRMHSQCVQLFLQRATISPAQLSLTTLSQDEPEKYREFLGTMRKLRSEPEQYDVIIQMLQEHPEVTLPWSSQ